MGQAETVGMSSQRLARIERLLADAYVAKGLLPGAQVQVWRAGALAYETVLGQADTARGEALARDTIFRLYSMTKPVTSVALMMLVEEGRVDLDDPVGKYIPQLADLGVFAGGVLGGFKTTPPAGPVKIIDLLRHTSGFTYGFQNRSNVDAAYRALKIDDLPGDADLAGMIDKLAKVPLEFSPGTAFSYGVSTDVAGRVVEVVSGQTLDVFFKTRIFDPLKMADTGFHVREGQGARLACCYALDAQRRMVLYDDKQASSYLAPPKLLAGGGGLVGTADDYMRFCRMLLAGGELDGARLLSPKTIKLMTTNQLPGGQEVAQMSSTAMFSEATFEGVGFGLGFGVTTSVERTRNLGSVGEFSWGGMASTAFWCDPVEDIAVVLMTQLLPSSVYPLRRQLRALVYSSVTDSNV